MTIIILPLPTPKKISSSYDHPRPLFHITYSGFFPPHVQYRNDCEQITLKNPHPITFTPYQTQTVYFPVFITTSKPCYALIYGSDLLFRLGLMSDFNIIMTNDSFLSTKVYNNTNKTCTFPSNRLTFNCLTMIAPIHD
jgi:hypothetical protein